ncbi:FecR family protein [Olivibacter domesticus]|uniref:FecR family protein n=1 Tax=Olivibacter domesticus TaxID=407022 RepID=A0A1H7R3B2_OLID1|nr:FecR family protein [Olivibacter domesticus]SEL54642.1 FecR family protein [Olivibacter domesticus]
MTADQYKQIAQKVANGTASTEEMETYLLYFKLLEKHQEDLPFDTKNQRHLKDSLKQRIDAQIQASPQSTSKKLPYKYAAAVALLVFSSLVGYYIQQNQEPLEKTVNVSNRPISDFQPKKTTLTLADGSTITLDDAAAGELAKQGTTSIIKSSDGKIHYKPIGTAAAATNSYNTISTQKGGQYQLALPDGSLVWLNAASSITYPTAFGSTERKVKVQGEAYFEIRQLANQPFIVETNNQEVLVLGTSFNINAYKVDVSETTLISGRVKVKNLRSTNTATPILSIGEKALVNHQGIQIAKANIEEITAWKNGYFQFQGELQDIMEQIGRWYDVHIDYRLSGKEALTFGGRISRNRSLQDVLAIIEATGNVHFKVEGRRVMVSK